MEDEENKKVEVVNKESKSSYIGIIIIFIVLGSVGYFFYIGGYGKISSAGGNFFSNSFDKVFGPFKSAWGIGQPMATQEIKKKLSMELYKKPDAIILGSALSFGVDIEYGDDVDLSKFGVTNVKYECGVYVKKKERYELLIKGEFLVNPKYCVVDASKLEELKGRGEKVYVGASLEFSKTSNFYNDFYVVSKELSKNEMEKLKSNSISEDGGPLKADLFFASSRKTKGPLFSNSDDILILDLANNWRDGEIILKNLEVSLPESISEKNKCNWVNLDKSVKVEKDMKIEPCLISINNNERVFSTSVKAKIDYDYRREVVSSVEVQSLEKKEADITEEFYEKV